MDTRLFAGYLLILLIQIPTLLYALLPLGTQLKFPLKRTFIAAASAEAAIIIGSAFVGISASITFKWIFIAALVPTFMLFISLTKGAFMTRLFCFLNSAMIAGNSIFYGMVLAAPLEKDGSYLTMQPSTCLVCIAVSAALGILYYRTLTKQLPYLIGSGVLGQSPGPALASTAFITLLFFWIMPKYSTVVMTGRIRRTILAFLLLAPAAFLLLYRSMWRIAVNLTENAELRETNELMAMEQKRYEELRSYMEETRNLRHDFRQHLLVIDDYARRGENDKLADYIGQFTESLAEYRPSLAANPALDAVALHYDSMAEDQKTHITWLIELPGELPVRESDFITIFGNLVENALIAVRGLPEDRRSVHVNARMLSDEMLGLTVRNPYAGEISFDRSGLPSNDEPGHGIGLQSVRAVVNRYHGALTITAEDSEFAAGVLLYLN